MLAQTLFKLLIHESTALQTADVEPREEASNATPKPSVSPAGQSKDRLPRLLRCPRPEEHLLVLSCAAQDYRAI